MKNVENNLHEITRQTQLHSGCAAKLCEFVDIIMALLIFNARNATSTTYVYTYIMCLGFIVPVAAIVLREMRCNFLTL